MATQRSRIAERTLSSYIATHPKGSTVTGKVVEVDAKGAVIALEEGVEGYLRASELARDRIEDARTVLKVGQEIDARLTGVDRKNRGITLSIRAKEDAEEAQALKDYGKGQTSGMATLGDIFKEQIDDSK